MAKLLEFEVIEIPDLVEGAVYFGKGRNFNVAMWDGEEFKGVVNSGEKDHMEEELHWDSHPKFGTFIPVARIDIGFLNLENYINKYNQENEEPNNG